MGYRTNGTWVIKGPVEQIIAAWTTVRLTVNKPDIPEEQVSWDEFKLYRVGNTGYIRFSFEDWKWYADFKSVQFYKAVWGCLEQLFDDQIHPDIAGRRVHVGEDDATEQYGFGNEEVNLFAYTKVDDDEPADGTKLIVKE